MRYALEYAVVLVFAVFMRLWPRRLAVWGGGIFGLVAGVLLRHDRAVARANLDLVFGTEISRQRKRAMVWGSFRRIGQVLTGLFWSPRLTPAKIASIVDGEYFFQTLRSLEARGKGAVLVTAHYGDWELLCHATAAAGLPILMITEPIPNPWLDRLITRLRGCTGNICIPPMYAMLKLFRALKRGQRVAMMCDVNGRRGRGGVWVNFCNRPVFNGAALAELALRTDAAVVFAVTIPQRGGRYHVKCFPPIEPAAGEDHEQDVQQLTQQVVDLHAQVLHDNPEPWLWTYKRWKRKPTPDAAGYPFYARFARVK